MSPRFRPPGKTFKERWPQEAEETRYLAATSYAVVLGGLAGLIMVPLMVSSWFFTLPLLVAIVVALVVGLTVVMPRASAGARRWLSLAWKIGAWVLAAGALGFVIEAIALGMCGDACRTVIEANRRPAPLGIPYALMVAGAIGIAIVVDRAGNALRRRAPSLAAPR